MTNRRLSSQAREPTWGGELYGEAQSQSSSRAAQLYSVAGLSILVIAALIAMLLPEIATDEIAADEIAADEIAADAARAAGSAHQAATLGTLERPVAAIEAPAPALISIRDVEPHLWARQQVPAPGAAQAIGSYHAGCVRGAVRLPASGLGYHHMRSSRRRFFGHPQLIDYIEDLGRRVAISGLGPVLVSDLGQARGGPTMSDHRSHQSGLDVDVWYGAPRQVSNAPLSTEQRDNLPYPIVVDRDNGELTADWTPQVALLLRLAAADSRVSRVFVNPAVKRELCRTSTGDRSWLGKIRPWYNHRDHFHLRIACPADSPSCKDQTPLGPGDGCGKTLDRWFQSKAAKTAKAKKSRNRLRAAKAKAKKKRPKQPAKKASSRARPATKQRFPTPPQRCLEVIRALGGVSR